MKKNNVTLKVNALDSIRDSMYENNCINKKDFYLLYHYAYLIPLTDKQLELVKAINQAFIDGGTDMTCYELKDKWRETGIIIDIISSWTMFVNTLINIDEWYKTH